MCWIKYSQIARISDGQKCPCTGRLFPDIYNCKRGGDGHQVHQKCLFLFTGSSLFADLGDPADIFV